MTQSLLRRLGVRDQNLTSLSICKADKAGVEQWLAGLPSANIGETTKQLYEMVEELLKLQTPADNRMQVLELIKPLLQKNIQSLSKHYQHKQALLPKKAQQVVDLTHALHMSMANNYTIAAVELAHAKSGLLRRPNKSLTAKAIFNAMAELNAALLLSYQLYAPSPRTLWVKLHHLYAIAKELDIQRLEVHKDQAIASVYDHYALCLLQGSIKANQLRQDDLLAVVDLLPGWLPLVKVNEYKAGEIPGLFVVNNAVDRGPVYAHLLNKQHLDACNIQLSTSELVQSIRQAVDSTDDSTATIDGKAVRTDLLNHLILAWGKCTKRSFMRIESDEQLEVCVGLNAAHQFAAGDTDLDTLKQYAAIALAREAAFEEFHSYDKLRGPIDSATDRDAMELEPENGDLETIDIDYGSAKQTLDYGDATAIKVGVNNASPGGYSLTLQETDQFKIHAGDLVGVKDSTTELWSIATIRWLHRPSRNELTFGVELLSPAFTPSVARPIFTEEEPGDYVPVLLLPEVSVTEQSASLLIADPSIQPGQTLQVLDRDEIRIVKLNEQMAKTRAYAQYSYENFDAANDSEGASEDLFESLWGNL